jgi:RHS repeat-associated protein
MNLGRWRAGALRAVAVVVLLTTGLAGLPTAADAGQLPNPGPQDVKIYCSFQMRNERFAPPSGGGGGDRSVRCQFPTTKGVTKVDILVYSSSGTKLATLTFLTSSDARRSVARGPGRLSIFQDVDIASTGYNGVQWYDPTKTKCTSWNGSTADAYCAVTGVVNGVGMPPWPDYWFAGGQDMNPPTPDGGDKQPDEEGGDGCSGGTPNSQADVTRNPVNTATGNFWHTFADIRFAGRGPSLALSRTYNSFDSTTGWFGAGWTSTFDASVTESGSLATVKLGCGSRMRFTESGGVYTAPGRVGADLVKHVDGSWTLSQHDGQVLDFDATGRLVMVSDRNGEALTITHTSSTAVVSDAAGRSLTFTFSSGLVTGVADSSTPGRTLSYSYDGAGNLTDVIDVEAGHWQFTYDANHRMTTMRSPRFYGDTTTTPTPVVTNHYDSVGRVDWQADELGHQTSFDYVSSPGSTIVADPAGRKRLYHYDHGILTYIVDGYDGGDLAVWTYTYDAVTTRVTSVTDPTGNASSFTYDSNGNVLTITDPLSRTTTATYNSMNLPLTVTDPMGVTATLTYDTNGNLLTSSTPWTAGPPAAAQVTTYHYDDVNHPGDITSITDALGKTWTYTYDAAGLVTSATDPLGNETAACFDSRSFATAAIRPSAVDAGVTCSTAAPAPGTTYSTYDNRGALTAITDPTGATDTNTYDANGLLATSSDANGQLTTFTRDAVGLVLNSERPDLTDIATSYFPDGKVMRQFDAAGAFVAYTYDGHGRQSTRTDELGRVTTYRYDLAGRLASVQDPNGNCLSTPKTGCTTYTYNAAGELTNIVYSDGTTPNVAFSYNANGRRTSMTDGSGTTTYAWDSLGRLTQSSRAQASSTWTVGYDWDLRDQLTEISYPNSLGTVERSYDDAGRLASVTDWLANTTAFSYDLDGHVDTITHPNGVTTSYTTDPAGRVDAIEHAPSANLTSPFASFAYGRDDIGQVTSVASAGVPTDDHTWTYTTLDQIVGDSAEPAGFGYDVADNLAQLDDGATQAFDAAHQLCWTDAASGAGGCGSPPVGATTYTYDARGNRTSSTAGGTTTTYGWNLARRLISHTTATGTTTYAYNGDGLRSTKTTGGSTTQYTWSVAQAIPALLTENNAAYVYGIGNQPIERISGTAVEHYHQDQLGSTRAITDSGGNVIATYAYGEFGDLESSTGSTTPGLGFAGEYTDAESGLVYLRGRYFEPSSGQFLSRDPMEPFTRSAYAYASSNPLNFTDPLGLRSRCPQPLRKPSVWDDWDLDEKKDWIADQLGDDFEEARRDDPGGAYVDFGLSFSVGVQITIGVTINMNGDGDVGDVHVYGGGGVGTPGVSVTSTVGTGQMSDGPCLNGQAAFGAAVAGGGCASGPYVEGGVGTPSASITATWVL